MSERWRRRGPPTAQVPSPPGALSYLRIRNDRVVLRVQPRRIAVLVAAAAAAADPDPPVRLGARLRAARVHGDVVVPTGGV